MAGGFGGMPGLGQSGSAMPTSTVEMIVKCANLCDKDLMSKSDPVCVLFLKKQGQWFEVGRTETVKNNHHPEWQIKFVMDYSFEQRQEVKFEIYDMDSKKEKLSQHDFLGRCETTLGAVVAARNHLFVSVLRDTPRSNGSKISVTSEELAGCKDVVDIQFAATKLDKKDTFGKSDPFFVLSKLMPSGQFNVVYKSEAIKNDLNPTWKPMKVKVRDLCNGENERQLKIDVYDWDSNGKHDIIGTVKTTYSALSLAVVEKKEFPCINEEKKLKKSSYKNSGMLHVKAFKAETHASFLDFIQSGTSMNFSIAVDFTASNGDPRDPKSLHYRDQRTGENQYTTAIRSVGDVIQDYDSDKQFPALGFGARVPPSGKVSDEFFLNLRPDNPYCFGVQGVLEAYYTALQHVTLYGPTNFSPVINHVARFAASHKDGRNYFVLLILTDGIITDLDLTVDAIVKASTLPMSIIIVGVGNEDFSAMEALDCDKGALKSGGLGAARDIVQFVELRKFLGAGNVWDKELLAKQVLGEIPQQLVQWMNMNKIQPGTAGS